MTKIDLDTMSVEELKDLRKDTDKAIAGFEERRRVEVLAKIEAIAKEHGYTLNELLGGKKAKRIATPKYRNPADGTQTWSGRGRQPAWYKDALASGDSPADLEI